MRRVGMLDSGRLAERFVRFLKAEGIAAQVDDDNGQWHVWVIDEDQVPQAREQFAAFVANPQDERFAVRVREVKREPVPAPKVRRPAERRQAPVPPPRMPGQPLARSLKWLLAINVIVYILQNIDGLNLTEHFELRGQAVIENFEIWRLLTYGFLHHPDHLMHLGMNMFGLWMFGQFLAPAMGDRAFVQFFCLAVICAGVACVLTEDPKSAVVGASGGVAAVVVMTATVYPRLRFLLFLIIPMELRWLAVLFVATDVWGIQSSNPGQIAYAAHLGGAAFAIVYRVLIWRRGSW